MLLFLPADAIFSQYIAKLIKSDNSNKVHASSDVSAMNEQVGNLKRVNEHKTNSFLA